jgi:hypothetical protein
MRVVFMDGCMDDGKIPDSRTGFSLGHREGATRVVDSR